jgi:hypothetical protein
VSGPATRLLRAGGDLVERLRSARDDRTTGPDGGRHSASGWLVVTVLCDPQDLEEEDLPAPLADLAGRIEVRTRPAPGDRGTELAARLRDRPARATAPQRLGARDPEAELRSALRRAKQLIEVGEVLVVDPTPHGERTVTPTGRIVDAWTRAAPGGGVR